MSRKIITIAVLFTVVLSGYCAPLTNPGFGYFIDLPEGWVAVDQADPAAWAFTDPLQRAVYQILIFPADSFNDAGQVCQTVMQLLGADGSTERFFYNDFEAMHATLNFNAGKYNSKGVGLFFKHEGYAFALLAFTSRELYDLYEDYLLSALNSFAVSRDYLILPGPLSWYQNPVAGRDQEPVAFDFNGQTALVTLDRGEWQQTQELIEREARILLDYQDNLDQAWERYYKIIFRDNYARLIPLAEAVSGFLVNNAMTDRQKAAAVLAWIQKFTYVRPESVSDLTSPAVCGLTASGDCDSRALLYMAVLTRLGIGSVLLVSTVYGHSAVAVRVDGGGAKINYAGRDYIFAELTAEVDLGLVARDMADPTGWQIIDPAY